MFEPIRIVIPGRGHGKVLVPNRYGHGLHLDKKSAAYMAVVSSFSRQVMRGRPPIDEAISIELLEIREVPKSWSKRDRAAALDGLIWPTSKPDLKNIMAGVEDAMNHIVWRDDALLVRYGALEKRYGERPFVIVTVRSAESAIKKPVDTGTETTAAVAIRQGSFL